MCRRASACCHKLVEFIEAKNMKRRRAIPADLQAKQLTLQPFVYKHGPQGSHYTDSEGIVWVTLEEFPEYEMSNTKTVRCILDKKVKAPIIKDKQMEFRFHRGKCGFRRNVNLLHRVTFNEFENGNSMENELWCELAEYPNNLISNMGRVLNKIHRSVLPGFYDDKYHCVGLIYQNVKPQHVRVHILVALAFLGLPPSDKHSVNHKNGTMTNGRLENNRLDNLEYATDSEQSRHANSTGLVKSHHPKKKLKVDKLDQEIWLPVPAKFVGGSVDHSYKVSNLGRISYGEFLMQRKPKARGYTEVSFWQKPKDYPALLHIVVATAFVPNPDNLPIVDHIDDDTGNSNATNLRWVTNRTNVEKALAKTVVRFNPETKESIVYPSCVKAAEANPGFIASSISRAANSNSTQSANYKDFQWYYPYLAEETENLERSQ